MKRGLSIKDRDLARQAAEAEKKEQALALLIEEGVEDVECACGCGVWKEGEMLYYVRVDDGKELGSNFRRQGCADRKHGLNRSELDKWGKEI